MKCSSEAARTPILCLQVRGELEQSKADAPEEKLQKIKAPRREVRLLCLAT